MNRLQTICKIYSLYKYVLIYLQYICNKLFLSAIIILYYSAIILVPSY